MLRASGGFVSTKRASQYLEVSVCCYSTQQYPKLLKMFMKNVRVKSHHQLKNSDKKQLKEQFKCSFPKIDDNDLDEILPKKETVSMLKMELTGNNTALVYVVNKKPIAFFFQDNLFPTVFLLWQFPDIMPAFSTHDGVTQKLKDGAHLMLPGLLHPTAAYLETPFIKSTPVYVNLADNKAAIAVGVTALSSNNILQGRTRGRCVTIYHVIGDKLCNLDNYECPPLPQLGLPEWAISKRLEFCADVCTCDQLSVESLSVDVKTEITEADVHDQPSYESEYCIKSDPDEDVDKDITQSMDDLLYKALITTVKYTKTLTLPIPASTLYKTYMIPACPAGKSLDVKKSSYKKLGQFLKTMMEFGILKIEELKKGVTSVTSVNVDHPCVRSFYLQPEDRPSKATNTEDQIAPPVIEEGYSVTAKVVPIFSEFGFKKGSTIANSNIRQYITEYVKRHDLQDKENQNIVNLDNVLKDVHAAQSQVSWQILMDNIYKVMSPYFKVVKGDNEMLHKGKLQQINISIAKKSGNKKVTLVDNLELYGINVEEVVYQCQKGVAASSSVNKSDKGNQLQVQGNQVTFINKLLTGKYKIPQKYIKGLELAPKKRK